MQEKIIKAKARAKIINNKELDEEQELKGEILGNHQQSLHSKQNKENSDSHTLNQLVIKIQQKGGPIMDTSG